MHQPSGFYEFKIYAMNWDIGFFFQFEAGKIYWSHAFVFYFVLGLYIDCSLYTKIFFDWG